MPGKSMNGRTETTGQRNKTNNIFVRLNLKVTLALEIKMPNTVLENKRTLLY